MERSVTQSYCQIIQSAHTSLQRDADDIRNLIRLRDKLKREKDLIKEREDGIRKNLAAMFSISHCLTDQRREWALIMSILALHWD